MKIWQLTPTDDPATDWRASNSRGHAIVRASSERRARQAAHIAFAVATTRELGAAISSCPWTDPIRVRCTELTTGEWPSEGRTEILVPEMSFNSARDAIAEMR